VLHSRGAIQGSLTTVVVVLVLALVLSGALLALFSATIREGVQLALEQGETMLRSPMRPIRGDTHVLLFALDGVGDERLREMLATERMPRLAALLGPAQEPNQFANGYAVPGALSIIPSTTMAAWVSVFTGAPVAETGVPGNEWYVREEMKFYAPGPISVDETKHTLASFTDGFLGKATRVPTLFELADVRSHVALLPIHRGADLLTVPSLTDLGAAFARMAGGVIDDDPVERDLYQTLEDTTVDQVVDALQRHGVPDLQVVYFPGIDLYTHIADFPEQELERYLEEVTDPAIGRILAAYADAGVLERTFVVFVSDHGHTPVLKDERHALGSDDGSGPPALLAHAGFRVRAPEIEVDDDDYQAVVAYQGAMANVYLANRSTCENAGERCSWMLPPRLDEDVLEVVRAFDRANRTGAGLPALQGTLDLIFAREPRPVGEHALPFQVWDGERLIDVADYLAANPREDFPDFEHRLAAFAAGPYGHRAGDVLLLAKSGMNRPISERFYFSRIYTSWHGSPEWQDSRVPIVVAHPNRSGDEIRHIVDAAVGDQPSQLDVTPLVQALLQSSP
jgi:hypothetical protein